MAQAKNAPKKVAAKAKGKVGQHKAPDVQAKPPLSVDFFMSAMEKMGFTDEDRMKMKERIFAKLSSSTARDHAMTAFFTEGASLLRPIVRVLTNHGEIINEAIGLSLLKRRNDVKSKLGQTRSLPEAVAAAAHSGQPPKSAQHHGKSRFRNGSQRPMQTSTRPPNPEKSPLKHSLGDAMRAAGVAPPEAPPVAPTEAPVEQPVEVQPQA